MASIFSGCVFSLSSLNICLKLSVSSGWAWKSACTISATEFLLSLLEPFFSIIILF